MDDNALQSPYITHAPADSASVIQAYLSDDAVYDRLSAIATRNGLSRVETGMLAQIVGGLMRGEIPPTEFIKNIIDDFSVDKQSAALIAQDVNREIFAPVKDALKEVHKVLPSERPGTDASPRPITMSRPVATPSPYVPNVPPIATPAQPKSILEQKLSGTFVAPPIDSPSAELSSVGNRVIPPPPTQTVPPAPIVPPVPPAPLPATPAELLAKQMFTQTKVSTPLPPPPPPPPSNRADPYREFI